MTITTEHHQNANKLLVFEKTLTIEQLGHCRGGCVQDNVGPKSGDIMIKVPIDRLIEKYL